MDDTQGALFASVCHALTHAGYDFGATDPAACGLYVAQEGQHVRVRWTPAPELITPGALHPERGAAPLPGIRDAIHSALATVLADAGLTIAASDELNTLRVTGTTLPG